MSTTGFAAWAAPTRPAPEPPRAPATAPAAQRGAIAPGTELAKLLGIGADELRRRWPNVHAALRGDPELLRRAATLPVEFYEELETARVPGGVRKHVLEAAENWERTVRTVGPDVLQALADLAAKGARGGGRSDDGAFDDDDEDDEDEDEDDDVLDEDDDEFEDVAPPRPASRAVSAPASAPASAPVSAPARTGHAATWQVLPPGELRRTLQDALRASAAVHLLYANSAETASSSARSSRAASAAPAATTGSTRSSPPAVRRRSASAWTGSPRSASDARRRPAPTAR
jgi:hypothetical protein